MNALGRKVPQTLIKTITSYKSKAKLTMNIIFLPYVIPKPSHP